MTALLAIALLFLQAAPPAQGMLTIQGTVTDPSGALVPGVLVTVKHDGNKLPRLAVTNEAGQYVLSGLLPREYELLAYVPGFERARRPISLTSSTKIDLVMHVAPTEAFGGISAIPLEVRTTPPPRLPEIDTRRNAEQAAAQLWQLTLRMEDVERSSRTSGRSYQAIREFYFFGGDAVPALVLALQDEDVQVRRNAAVILAYFASPPAGQAGVDILEAISTLRERLQDADAEVRQVARKVIEAIESGR